MAFTLHPTTQEDVEDITNIFQAAFANDPIMSHFYPKSLKDVQWERDLKTFRLLIEEANTYGGHFTKVVDNSTGKIVAFSKWQYPFTATPEQMKEKQKTWKQSREPPEGANKELMDEFFKQLRDGRKKWIAPEKTYFLHILAVHPDYQRRGLGAMLIRPGLEDADKAGAQTYIEASPSGLPLYLKHGWVPVDEMVIDMGKYGGHEVRRQKYLMREPHAGNKDGKVDIGKM